MKEDTGKRKVNRGAAIFVALFLLFAPLRAYAQVCEIPPMITAGGTALDAAQKAGVDAMVLAIQTAIGGQVTAAITLWTAPLVGLVDVWGLAIRTSFGNWWNNWLNEALLPMTREINAVKVDQSRNLGSTMEAQNQSRAQRDMEVKEAEAVRKFQPADYMCVADTLATTTGQTRAQADAAQNSLVQNIGGQGTNTVGSGVQHGRAEAINRRWDIYANNFCNNQANNGNAGCAGVLPKADKDVAVGTTLFRKDTIDVADPQDVAAVEELTKNIASFQPSDPIAPNSLASVTGREYLLRQRRFQTQMNAVTAVLGDIVGERLPGSGPTMPQAMAARLESGAAPGDVAARPSARELRQAVVDQLWSPKFYNELNDEPHTAIQKEVYLKAYSNVLLYDLISRTEQIATLFAIELGNMTDEVGQKSNAIAERPILP